MGNISFLGGNMRYRDHLNVLIDHFTPTLPIETTISELARIINCSERHTKTIMKSLQEQDAVKWEIKKGRGKKPELTILRTKEQFLLEEAKQLVEAEEYRAAFELSSTLGSYQGEFENWLEAQLGFVQRNASKGNLDILRYPFYETNLSLDPLTAISRHDSHMIEQIFERLVEYDVEESIVRPRIARHWESIDGKVWIFYLQKDVRFHHGRELTSEDVRESFNRMPKDYVIRKPIKEITTPSPYVVVFHLNQQDYLFPRYLASFRSSIVPYKLVSKEEVKFNSFPIGAGPYRITGHDENIVRLDVFKDYFRERPWLDRIEIIKTKEPHESFHPLLLRAPDDTWEEVREIEEGADYISLNCNRPLLGNFEIRKHVCNLIDPGAFCYGNETVATSFLPKRSLVKKHIEKTSSVKPLLENISLKIAVQQIREGVNHEREALILQKQLKVGGIPSTLDIVNTSQWNDPDCYSQYDIFVGGLALSRDRLLSVLSFIHSNQLMLYPFMDLQSKSVVNDFMNRIRSLEDEESRWSLYFDMEDYLRDQYHLFFLNHRYHTIYQPKQSEYVNIELNHNGRVDYRNVWKRLKVNEI